LKTLLILLTYLPKLLRLSTSLVSVGAGADMLAVLIGSKGGIQGSGMRGAGN
jgi:hypothetical protein